MSLQGRTLLIPHFIDGEIKSQTERVVTCTRSPSKGLSWDLNPAVGQQAGTFHSKLAAWLEALGWLLGTSQKGFFF